MKKQKALITTKRMLRRHHYYQVTRNYKGQFIKFKKWHPIHKMWRLTLAINYAIHHKYYCIKIQAWHRNLKTLKRKIPRIETTLWDKLETILKPYTTQEMMDSGVGMSDITGAYLDTDNMRLGTELAKVPFDTRLVGTEEYSHEHIRDKHIKETKQNEKKEKT